MFVCVRESIIRFASIRPSLVPARRLNKALNNFHCCLSFPTCPFHSCALYKSISLCIACYLSFYCTCTYMRRNKSIIDKATN